MPTNASHSEARLCDDGRRLVADGADGMCLPYCDLVSEDLNPGVQFHDSVAGNAHDLEVTARDMCRTQVSFSELSWSTSRAEATNVMLIN